MVDEHASGRGENDIEVGEQWDLPFKTCVRFWDTVSGGKGSQGAGRTVRKGIASWWRDGYIYRSKSVPTKTKCRRVLSHACSTALDGSVNWPWSVTMLAKVRTWEATILRPKMYAGESWVGFRKREQRSLCV